METHYPRSQVIRPTKPLSPSDSPTVQVKYLRQSNKIHTQGCAANQTIHISSWNQLVGLLLNTVTSRSHKQQRTTFCLPFRSLLKYFDTRCVRALRVLAGTSDWDQTPCSFTPTKPTSWDVCEGRTLRELRVLCSSMILRRSVVYFGSLINADIYPNYNVGIYTVTRLLGDRRYESR